jgi:filamentous hemagglutinin family protein
MNRAYRLVWNEERNSWVAAPEIASARGKRGGARRGAATLLLALAAGSHASLAADLAPGALPGGGQVTAGQASIGSSGANMAIDQGSQRAIINWQNFDIGSQASVTFRQPDASAVALNRVSGPTASRIEGQLTANGQVFLINPSGVLFGKGARVHVGGLVASTLNIRDDDFLSGNFVFSGNGGSIANEGRITAAPGGYLAFISPAIANSGAVSAPQGTVAMGAGERVRLNFAGDRLVGLDVSAAAIDTLIENRQAIRAEGGAILLTAAGAEAVTRGVINNSGVLEASSLTSDGGRIVLTAGNDITLGAGSTVAVDGKKGGEITVQARTGTLLADGSLAARGAAGKGGDIQLLGHQVGLVNAAQVDASGATGGGTVLVGGDYQGANAGVQNAFRTYVGPQATITADALQQGDGGKVIVWADDATRFYGSISARGGSQSGNGGFVETSGKEYLEANGSVDASAPAGLAGQWLLDPRNITINTAGPTSGGTALPNFDATADNAVVDRDDIQTSLNTGTNVTITTGSTGTQAGNITVASAIAKTAGGNATLTLNAANNIVFNSGANVGSTAGQLGFTLNAGGGINNLRGVSLNGGTLTLNAAGAVTQSSPITGNTTVVKNGAGTFTLSQSNTYTGATTVNAGTLALGASNVLANGSSLVVNGGTFNIANRSDTVAGVQLLSGAITGTTGTLTSTSAYDVQAGTVSARLGGTAGLTKTTSGTVTLSGANTYTGATNINAGTLALGASNIIANASAVTVAAGATFDLAGYSETIGSLAGAGTVTKTGAGATTLTAGADNTSTTFSGVIQNPTGTLNLTKTGAGTLTLSGANTYTGVTTINGGALTAAGGSAIADTSQVTLANTAGATLNLANSETIGNLSGGGTTGGNVTLGANTLTVNQAGTTTYGGVLSGAGGLTKAGAGTLTLSGNNAYAGATSINAGTLTLGNSNRIADASAVTVAAGATFNLAGYSETIGSLAGAGTVTKTGTGTTTLTVGADDTATVFSGVIQNPTGTLNLTKTGAGTLTLSGANTYRGVTNVNAGTLVAANASALGAATAGVTVANGATLGMQGGITVGAEALSLSGTGVAGDGALRNLSGNNTWGGTVTLAGNAEIQSDAGTLTLSAANSVTGATRNLTVDGTGNTAINGTITTTSGALIKNGTGTLTLSGANTAYAGAISVNAGTLAVTANNALGTTAAGTAVANGATLDFRNVAYATGEAVTLNGGSLATSAGTSSFAGPVTLGANSNVDVAGTQLTLSGAIGGAGFGINKQGNGALVLSGNNTYTGATNINAGTLTATGGNAIADASQVNLADVAGATLGLAGNETIGNLAGGGASGGNVTLGGNTLTVNQTAATTYAGVISGTGDLTKTGTDTLTLAGSNTYTGMTNINAGALVAANAAALGAPAGGTSVGSNARLIIDGVAIGAEPVTLNGPGLFGAGAITSNGNASLTGPITLAADSIVAPNSGSVLTLAGAIDGAFALTKQGLGTLVLNGAVGGTTALTSLTTSAGGATAIGGGLVRTSGNQTYNDTVSLGAPTTLATTANGSITANGSVAANGNALALSAGAGNVTMQNAANDFASVAIAAATNVALRDANAIDLGASAIGANLALTAGGAVTDSGALTVAGATALNAGTNDITLDNANDFRGNVAVQSGGNVRLNDINDLTLDLSGFSTLTATAGGTLTLAGRLTASGAGDAIVLSGGRFVNNAGATALSAPNGRWLVWSSNPNPFAGATPDNPGGLAYDFRQYNAFFGVTPVAQPTGNGFLYTLAPTITPGLTGTVSKVYDATTTATLAPGNFTASGAVGGDTVTLSAASASYDNRNVGTGKTVTATGITASASNGTATVYGYTVSPTTASANIGQITPAALTVASIAAVNTTYGTPAATGAVSLNGVIGGDVVTSTAGIVGPAYSTSGNLNAGSYAQSAGSLSGADAGNYTLTPFTTPANNYTVAQLALTGTAIAASGSTYGAPLTPGAVSFGNVIAGDAVTSTTSVNTATLSSSGNPVVGSYTQMAGALAGADAANYSFAGYTTPAANYTISPLALTGSITASDKTYDSATAATIASRSLSGVIGGDSVVYTGGTATFADRNAGAAKTVTATGLWLSGTDAGNYTVNATATTTASITPAPLVITANDAQRPVNTPNPPFSATYSGFVGGETPAVLNGILSLATPATLASPAGIYTITPHGQSSGNYAITYVDGRLTIQGGPVVTLPVFPREVVSQQAIGAQYTDPTVPTNALTALHYTFVDHDDAQDGKVAASVVRVIGSGIRLPN